VTESPDPAVAREGGQRQTRLSIDDEGELIVDKPAA
jgi:hypothetical protein